MSDIVERLRTNHPVGTKPDPLLFEAADEIESLRQQLAECNAMYADLEAVYGHSVDNENTLTAMLAQCQATNKTFYYEKGMVTTALDTLLKQAKREALLIEKNALTGIVEKQIAYELLRMAKELE